MKNKLGKRILSLFLVMLMVISVVPFTSVTAEAASVDSKIQKAIDWAVSIANDNSHGYSQYGRTGPDYDCSSLVSTAFNKAGFNVPGNLNTGNMKTNFGAAGFTWIPASKLGGMSSSAYLQKGDILWRTGHTELYIGNNKICGATNGSKDGYGNYSNGEKKGDQTGKEIRVSNYYAVSYSGKKWEGVLRCKETNKPSKPPVPSTPTISNISATNIAKGKAVTINWNSVSNAESYDVFVRSNSGDNEFSVGKATSYKMTLPSSGKYTFWVRAKNSSGKSAWSATKSCTAYDPVKVSFVDYDGTPLSIVKVDYGSNATAPSAPQRKGYSFQGWSDSFYNVTSNKTITATYKVNTYIVNFLDKNGAVIGESQKVNYGEDATPPTEVNTPNGYVFSGWQSEDYKNVYTDALNKTINIQGIYTWGNDDLPVVCTDLNASRQTDGYYVNFNLVNYDKDITRGRAVVMLKTASGKLVDMTESAAFSLPKNESGTDKKAMEVFVPCDYAATSVEVIIVGSYSQGVPISEKVSCSIDQGLMWSNWSTTEPPADDDVEKEERILYRYRDKKFTTGNTKNLSGWIWDGTGTEKTGSWSSWQNNAISGYTTESVKREVGTQSVQKQNYKTQYKYFHYKDKTRNDWMPSKSNSNYERHDIKVDYKLSYIWTGPSADWYGHYSCASCNSVTTSSYRTKCWIPDGTCQTPTNKEWITQYRYRDIYYTYNFYQWQNWSDWSVTPVTETANRDVETKTEYRYKSISAGIENDEGKVYTQSGKLDSSFAGEQLTLFVYKVDGASDYTNEFVGQTVVGEDGSWSFSFKLREEPSVKTGDYTVAIGIEGNNDLIIVDTIEAPKPTYTVKFFDWEGSVISTQTVVEGEDAVLPENPEKEGYDFIGWDKSVANIKEDTEIFADFQKKEYTVVFIDWEYQQVEIKKFNHGDALVAPDYELVDGHTFKGWDAILDGDITVTKDMVVTAKYDINEYTVTFYDFDNNVISEQIIEYGKSAVAPENIETGEDGEQFAGWFDYENYTNVERDLEVYPVYYFEETAATPTANYESGEYGEEIELTLSTDDENAVIFYYLNGNEMSEQIYTEPIKLSKTASVTYYATSFGKNDSESATGYYCINTGDKPSEWMLYSEIPQDVKDNLSDYTLESDWGYRYKNTRTASSTFEEIYGGNWILEKEEYSPWTAWQDEEIEVPSTRFGFEIETQEVDDTSVKWYQYSHYKYTDENGEVKYSPTEVEDYACEYEEIVLETRLSIAGFTENDVNYYNYNGQQWFTQTRVNGKKTQYRSRYQVKTYYQWTGWTLDAPSSNETRVYEEDDVYRYSNKNYHIVTVVTDLYETPEIDFVVHEDVIDTTPYNSYGYELEGLYYDEALTSAFDVNTPVTESVTLYAKYTPNKYTVTFQTADGTEIDSQSVEYMGEATAPETDVVPGYVFGGWDKDFSCITEDTVIKGKYFKEEEYARVTLNLNNVSLYSGTSVQLIGTISPDDLTDEVIEWTSSDNAIASVDNTGLVTAVSQGEATITATVVKTKETATCVVRVTQDLATGILLKNGAEYNYDSLGYLRRVSLGTSAQTVSAEFENIGLRFFNISGAELSSGDVIGTGTEIRLYNGDDVADMKTVVVTGDMTGDGAINNRDVAMMNKQLVGKVTAKECQMLAIDVNGDGSVNNRDAAMVARYLVGKDNF